MPGGMGGGAARLLPIPIGCFRYMKANIRLLAVPIYFVIAAIWAYISWNYDFLCSEIYVLPGILIMNVAYRFGIDLIPPLPEGSKDFGHAIAYLWVYGGGIAYLLSSFFLLIIMPILLIILSVLFNKRKMHPTS
jgi:hypothetical protein